MFQEQHHPLSTAELLTDADKVAER